VSDSILGAASQIKNFSSRYDSMPWVDKLPAEDRRDFEDRLQERARVQQEVGCGRGQDSSGYPTSSPEEFPDFALHHEMEMLVESGLTPMQALKSATSWSAEILEGKNKARSDAKIGSIRVGNFADLVVVSADPLSDISNTKKIERVMKNGRWGRAWLSSPNILRLFRPARSLAAATFRAHDQLHPAKQRQGRVRARTRGVGRQRVHDDVPGACRRRVGQDDFPRPAAPRVRSAGPRHRAAHAESLLRARAGAKTGINRVPRRFDPRL